MKYRTDDRLKVGAPITGSIPLELGWSIIPFLISIVIFVWATIVFFDLSAPPDQTLEIYVDRQAVDVEVSSTSTARARSTSCTCRSAARSR